MNDMVDMSQFVEAKSDQLNADDLIGGPRTITVRRVTGNDGDQPISIYYEGDNNKPFKPCKTMRRVLLGVWGRDGNAYVGRSMTLYRDDSVTFGGLAVGGIRASHMSHIDKETVVVVNKTKGKKVGVKILPLADAPQQSATKDEAREWTDKFIGNVGRAPDAAKLDAFVAGKAELLADLAEKRPELHAECHAAIDAKRASFAPTDDDPFAEPATEDETARQLRIIRTRIADAETDKVLKTVDATWVKARAAYADDVAAEIDGLIAAKRRELSSEGEGVGG